MDEKTARQLVRNTFDLLAAGDRALAAAEPALIAAFQRVTRLLETLPPVGDVMREKAWRAMKPAVLQALEPATGQLGLSIVNELAEELKAQVAFATNVLQTRGEVVDKNGITHTTADINIGGFSVDEPGASAARRAAGDFSQNVRSIEAPWTSTGTIAQIGGAAVPDTSADNFTIRVPPSVARQISRTRISGQTLERAFPISIEGTGATMTLGRKETGFTQFMLNTLDTRVRTALLRGDTTEEVSRELIFDSMKQGLNLGPTANQLKNYARAAARTALMDGSQRIQEEVWDANPGVIAGWEFDASNDSRTCPRCFPLDGLFSKEKSGIPATPIHPACRCRRLPVTNTALLMRAEGGEPGGSSVELVAPGDVPPRRDGESTKAYKDRLSADRYYLTKGKAGGERWVRRAIDHKAIKQQMDVADLPKTVRSILLDDGRLKPGQTKIALERGMTGPQWLAQRTTTEASRQVAFGGGHAGAVRSKLFNRWLEQGMSPEKAFDKLLVGGKANTSFIPLKKLQEMGIKLPEATPIRSEAYLKRLAKRRAAQQKAVFGDSLEKQLAEAREEAAIQGDDGRVEELEAKLRARRQQSAAKGAATRQEKAATEATARKAVAERESYLRTPKGLASWTPKDEEYGPPEGNKVVDRRPFARRVDGLSDSELRELITIKGLPDWKRGIAESQLRMRPVREAKRAAFAESFKQAQIQRVGAIDRVADRANAGRAADMQWRRVPEERDIRTYNIVGYQAPTQPIVRAPFFQPPTRLTVLPDEIAKQKAEAAFKAQGFVKPRFLAPGVMPPQTDMERRYFDAVWVQPGKMRSSVNKGFQELFSPDSPPTGWAVHSQQVLRERTAKAYNSSLSDLVFNPSTPVEGSTFRSRIPEGLRAPSVRMKAQPSLDHRVVERLAEITQNELPVLGTVGDNRAGGAEVAKALGRLLPKIPDGTVIGVPWSVLETEGGFGDFNKLLARHANGSGVWHWEVRRDHLERKGASALEKAAARGSGGYISTAFPALAIKKDGKLVPLNLENPREALRLLRKAKKLSIDYFRPDAKFDASAL